MLTSLSPRTFHFRSLSLHGFHRVAYYDWGARDNPNVVVCVHGIGRNGRDFDVLGEALAPTHRVLAPDMPGRGASEWLRDPMDYVAPTYLTTLTALIARSGVEEVAWVGTSMGALLGIMCAAHAGHAGQAVGRQRCGACDRARRRSRASASTSAPTRRSRPTTSSRPT